MTALLHPRAYDSASAIRARTIPAPAADPLAVEIRQLDRALWDARTLPWPARVTERKRLELRRDELHRQRNELLQLCPCGGPLPCHHLECGCLVCGEHLPHGRGIEVRDDCQVCGKCFEDFQEAESK